MLASLEKKDDKEHRDDENHPSSGSGGGSDAQTYTPENKGTLMIDAACAPSNIRYPQDYSLLNETREKLESIIIRFCKSYGFHYPRMYHRQAGKNYLALAKTRKRSSKQIRATIRKQGYLGGYMANGYAPTSSLT